MPFAFWPMTPVVPRVWLDFIEFASTRADGTWLFRGHGDASWELVPAIGRQASASVYRPSDEKILFEDFVLEAKRYLGNADLTELEWLAVAQHHGLPTRLLDWPTNPLVAAWFATQADENDADAKVLAIRVPFGQRARDAAAFGSTSEPPLIVEVSPRVARITAQQGCFSLHPDPRLAWLPPADEYDYSTFWIPGSEKADFRRLLHVFGCDAHRIYVDMDALGRTLAWRYRQR